VIAGFGVTSELTLGERAFAAVDVATVDESYFVTSAAPFSGACIGDSGGPLLARDRNGIPRVLGLLSSGSGSCRGRDSFSRLDLNDELLELVPELEPNEDLDCEGLGTSGACFSSELALWCEGRALRREPCADGRACGWDEAAAGYRCLDSAADDPCASVSSFGVCERGVARRCDAGALMQDDCAGCGLGCVRDPLSGQVGCGARSGPEP
jgi:hypothetical protein